MNLPPLDYKFWMDRDVMTFISHCICELINESPKSMNKGISKYNDV